MIEYNRERDAWCINCPLDRHCQREMIDAQSLACDDLRYMAGHLGADPWKEYLGASYYAALGGHPGGNDDLYGLLLSITEAI